MREALAREAAELDAIASQQDAIRSWPLSRRIAAQGCGAKPAKTTPTCSTSQGPVHRELLDQLERHAHADQGRS